MLRRSLLSSFATARRVAVQRGVPRALRSAVIPSVTHHFNRSNIRFNSTQAKSNEGNKAQLKVDKQEMMVAMTCKKCNTRSSHIMSKQAYTSGTVLIKCPGCENRHLIADHLKIFSDDRITIEDILSAKGESVSSSTDDLVFDDIPEKLKGLIGHHAKDAPESQESQQSNDKEPHLLPEQSEKK